MHNGCDFFPLQHCEINASVGAAPLWNGGVVTETLLKIATQAILSAPALIYVTGLERARRVFRRIGDGDIFTRDNSQSLVAVGATLLVGALWPIAVAGLAPLDQLHHSTNINHELSDIGFAAADIALAALGLTLIMIGRVTSAATDLKSENDRFV